MGTIVLTLRNFHHEAAVRGSNAWKMSKAFMPVPPNVGLAHGPPELERDTCSVDASCTTLEDISRGLPEMDNYYFSSTCTFGADNM